jgi:hypothetical protein
VDQEHCLKHGGFISGKEVECQPNARAGVVSSSSSAPAPSLQLLLCGEPALNAARQIPDCQAVNSCLPAATHKADSWQQKPRNAAKDLFQQLHREPLPRGERRGYFLAHSTGRPDLQDIRQRSKQCLWICIGLTADLDPAFLSQCGCRSGFGSRERIHADPDPILVKI